MTDTLDSAVGNVCTQTVSTGLCVGCGVCAGVCPGGNLEMRWTSEGRLEPSDLGRCLRGCQLCLEVCPFQDQPANEDMLAAIRFRDEGLKSMSEAGLCLEAFVGHASAGDFRSQGASGGLATWFLSTLLHQQLVDRVVCVVPTGEPQRLFRFTVCSSADEVRRGAKSAYYPVELSEVLRLIHRDEARYAIVGLPCFLKGLARAMQRQPWLNRRVTIMAGLVCGQLKSSAYSNYLMLRLGVNPERCQQVSFRTKVEEKRACDYLFSCESPEGERSVPWSDLYGSTWLSGQFKLRSCCFCDDTFAEVADVAFMDAWLPEYMADGRGTSIALVRSKLVARVLRTGVQQGEAELQPLSVERAIASQAGVVHDKRQRLAWRLWIADRRGTPRPRKRVAPARPPLCQRFLLQAYEDLRALSHTAFARQRQLNSLDLGYYHRRISRPRRRVALCLLAATGVQVARAVVNRLSRLIISRGSPSE